MAGPPPEGWGAWIQNLAAAPSSWTLALDDCVVLRFGVSRVADDRYLDSDPIFLWLAVALDHYAWK
jgi:hypothetical protein